MLMYGAGRSGVPDSAAPFWNTNPTAGCMDFEPGVLRNGIETQFAFAFADAASRLL